MRTGDNTNKRSKIKTTRKNETLEPTHIALISRELPWYFYKASGILRSGSTPENSLKKKKKFLKIVVYTYGLFNWFDEL